MAFNSYSADFRSPDGALRQRGKPAFRFACIAAKQFPSHECTVCYNFMTIYMTVKEILNLIFLLPQFIAFNLQSYGCWSEH